MGEYFQRLFAELGGHLSDDGVAWMILSEDCAIDRIEAIAREHGVEIKEHHRERRMLEWNFVYELDAPDGMARGLDG